VVVNVEPESPAERGGLLIGDILLALDERALRDPGDVLSALGGDRIGASIAIRVARGGRAERLTVTVGERPRERR
jgi:S1-C subfamily serine protease